jgi:enoyl-CoA hydratase/carnithine racemase
MFAIEDGVARITLHRPEVMNAINQKMVDELLDALDRADADPDVRAIILTGSGSRAFCAGADVSGGAATFDYANRAEETRPTAGADGTYRDAGGRVALRIHACLKPVIAAINGVAAGAGATIILAADIRIAADTARFAYVFGRRGIVPESASAWFLPRIVGMQTALQWCLTGRIVSASEALARDLVWELCPPDELMKRAMALAREMADNVAPVSAALIRQMFWRLSAADHPMAAHRVDSRLVQELGPRPDAQEGVAAFIEKRLPHFPGRVPGDLPPGFPWWEEPDFS